MGIYIEPASKRTLNSSSTRVIRRKPDTMKQKKSNKAEPNKSAIQGNACQPRIRGNYPNLNSATETVMQNALKNAVLAFGYTHREQLSQRSAVYLFAKFIVPRLAKSGYRDLVLEIFPVGLPANRIEQEINAFNKNGVVGPEMQKFINVVDRENFLFLLRQIKTWDIRIHSGGINRENIKNTIECQTITPECLRNIDIEIARNSHDKITALQKQGVKTASLNGCVHNDIYPKKEKAYASFGERINRIYKTLVEIDLVIPELSQRHQYYRDIPVSDKCNWRKFIPKSGVELVSEKGPNSYMLVWPDQH